MLHAPSKMFPFPKSKTKRHTFFQLHLMEKDVGLQPALENLKMTENNTSETPKLVRVKNRRKRYLDTHPEYFSPALELAGPRLTTTMLLTHSN